MTAYICDYIRTPIGRYGGALSSIRADDLATLPIKALMSRNADVDWGATDEVILGNTNQAGEDNRNVARMAALLSGLPETVPGITVNRLCASGLDAIAMGARAIRTGEAELIIAGGVESMSRAPFVMPKSTTAFSRDNAVYDTTIGWRFVNPTMNDLHGTDSMPETGENVAEAYNVSREDQDAFALRSQQRAGVAMQNGRLAKEIVPVEVARRKQDPLIVDTDEHPRPQTTAEALAKLGTPFRKGGSVTAGNASGVNDGAAAVLLASEESVMRYNLKPIARVLGAAAAGVPPRVMGVGPITAVEKLLRITGKKVGDIDVMELNEAFASQALAVLRGLGIADDAEFVNPNGGAIALGHPLGASGARIVGSAALEMQQRDAEFGIATMCVGVGQGSALALGRA